MYDSKIAARYAKSLLDLASEKGVLEEVHANMQLFMQIGETNRDFVLMLGNPIINHEKKQNILHKLFDGKIHPVTAAIFEIITRKHREALLPGIAREFHKQYNALKGVEAAEIITPFKLSEELRGRFEQLVKETSKKDKVELKEKIDPELIGGYILRIQDRQIDESLKSKLNRLKVEFSKNPYIKEY